MKNILLFAASFFFTIKKIDAQVTAAMPTDASKFYDNSMPLLRPQVKDVIIKTAAAMKHHKANTDSLSQAIRLQAALHGMSSNDIDGIIVLIMVQASKNADADLKSMVMGISHEKELKKAENKKTSADDEATTQKIKLQMIIDHKSDIAEEVNYVMKKISDDQQSIINNLK